MNRRDMLLSMAGGVSASVLGAPSRSFGAPAPKKTKLGVASFSYHIRLRARRAGGKKARLADPLNFLEHCHQLRAGGIQTSLGTRDEAYTAKLRQKAQTYGMFVEGSASLPRDKENVGEFEAQVVTAKRAGAKVIRVAIGGRRYEQFDNAADFRAFFERSWKSVALAEPVAARHGIRLAIENHKDWRIPEFVGQLKRLDSEFVGICVDLGNSISLLEDPTDMVRAFAPWAFSAHVKDAAVREYEEGFLLADVILGEGFLDLPGIIRTLRRARPEIQFSLEMATRDALEVPCLTEKYWATFDDVPGRDLARMLKLVRAKVSKEAFPRVSQLPVEEQIALEEKNIKRCLVYARDHLGL